MAISPGNLGDSDQQAVRLKNVNVTFKNSGFLARTGRNSQAFKIISPNCGIIFKDMNLFKDDIWQRGSIPATFHERKMNL